MCCLVSSHDFCAHWWCGSGQITPVCLSICEAGTKLAPGSWAVVLTAFHRAVTCWLPGRAHIQHLAPATLYSCCRLYPPDPPATALVSSGFQACRRQKCALPTWMEQTTTTSFSSCCCIPYLHRVGLGTASPRLGFISFLSNYKRKVGGMRLIPFRLL